jgi:heptosyltransferase-2
MGTRVLVLKIAALGDVLRTTPILSGLARRTSEKLHVTWVVGSAAEPLLRAHPRIDRLWTPGYETSERLEGEKFDLVLSLDKDAYSTSLATRVSAREKRGFGRDSFGSLVTLHAAAQYAYDLGLSDRLKFHENEKTYQEIIFEMCGLDWRGDDYDVPAALEARERGQEILASSGVAAHGGPVVGFNTGAGSAFANKAWTIDGFTELSRLLARDGCRVVLLGGARESERNREIARRTGGAAVDAGASHGLREFAGIVAACDLVVTGDTLGMHLALAARVPLVVLFGSTCSQEIELYGRGEKVVTPISCHPCYLKKCDITPSCQDLITPAAVHAAVSRVLAAAQGR